VNALMNLGVQLNTGISLLAEDLLASQEWLCSMELISKKKTGIFCVQYSAIHFPLQLSAE
jgi:hypothetical protein